MKRNCFFAGFVVTMCIVFASLVGAQDYVLIYKTDTPVTIDGEIDAVWDKVEENIVEKVIVNTTDGPSDLYGEWKALWDDDNFYLLVVVTDDQLYDDSDGANEHDDGLDVVFDTDNGDETSPDTNDDFILTIEYSSTGDCAISGEKWSYGTLPVDGIVAKCIESEQVDGYNIEASIPLVNLNLSGDEVIGFGLRINDDDDGGDRDSQISWYIDTADNWANPSTLASAELAHEIVGVDAPGDAVPARQYLLEQNYPNPFNPQTTIHYELQKAGMVTVEIYNELGQRIRTLANEYMQAGRHQVHWDATDEFGDQVESGIYLCRLSATDHISLVRKMLFIK
jgi:hypothetical protein